MTEPSSLIDEAASSLSKLHDLCLGFGFGAPPDSYSVLGVVNELVFLYEKLADEQSQKFGNSQRKRLTRKVNEAKSHRSLRELKKTMAECEKESFLAVELEQGQEIDAMQEYELYVAIMRAVQEAIRYGISVNSSVRNQESHS